MSHGILETQDFDKYLTLSEKAARHEAVTANDAFLLAMTKAVRKGRETAKPGTYVDLSPAIGSYRIRGEVLMSACGSPAAMCCESGGTGIGAEAMK